MDNEKKIGSIFAKMAALTAEIGAIGKTNNNKFQNYNFRSVGQAMAALQPLLVKHGVILQPCYTDMQLHAQDKGYTATCCLALSFIAVDDGSMIMVRSIGQGADAGDKATYKAMAGAFKYAVFQSLCVPEDGADAEFADPEVKPKATAAAAKPSAKTPGNGMRDILG